MIDRIFQAPCVQVQEQINRNSIHEGRLSFEREAQALRIENGRLLIKY